MALDGSVSSRPLKVVPLEIRGGAVQMRAGHTVAKTSVLGWVEYAGYG